MGSTSLGALLYAGQLAANLLAAGFCLPMLPKADAHGVREVPCKKEKQEIPCQRSISSAASTAWIFAAGDFFPRGAGGFCRCALACSATRPASVAACNHSRVRGVSQPLAARRPLYGICLAMSLRGFSVWGPAAVLTARRGADADCLHKPPAACRPLSLLVRLLLWALRRSRPCFSTLAPRVVPIAACRRMPLWWRRCFFAHCFTKVYKTFYNYNISIILHDKVRICLENPIMAVKLLPLRLLLHGAPAPIQDDPVQAKRCSIPLLLLP